MARRKKLRYKRQGEDFVVGQLRKIAKDPETPAWIRVICLDRLAMIDECYQVEILSPSTRVAKLPKPPAEDTQIEPEIPAEEQDIEGKVLLDEFNRKFYNKGE